MLTHRAAYIKRRFSDLDAGQLLQVLASLLAKTADSFFFEPPPCFEEWYSEEDPVEIMKVDAIRCSEDLTLLVQAMEQILVAFGVVFPAEDYAGDPIELEKGDVSTMLYNPHTMGGNGKEVLRKIPPEDGIPMGPACTTCEKVGEIQMAVTGEWVCLDCWRQLCRPELKNESHDPKQSGPHKTQERDRLQPDDDAGPDRPASEGCKSGEPDPLCWSEVLTPDCGDEG